MELQYLTPIITTYILTDPNVRVEGPGVQNVSESGYDFDYYGVETFDSLEAGSYSNHVALFGGGPITGTYTNLNVNAADRFGGAAGTGNYAVAGLTHEIKEYSLKLFNPKFQKKTA